MKYAIANKDKTAWVCQENGSFSLTTNKSRAIVFDTQAAANKVFDCNLSKLLKYNIFIK